MFSRFGIILECNRGTDRGTDGRTHDEKMKWNAVCPTLTLNEQWPAAWQPGWMARGSHSFTCHPHVYPRMEWAILHLFRKHSPDGVARARWRTSGSAYYSSIDIGRMKGWVGLVGKPNSRWFIHISGHPSATGRAWTGKVRRTGVLPLCNAANRRHILRRHSVAR